MLNYEELDELYELYESIKASINEYNSKSNEKIDIIKERNVDVSDLFICAFNNDYVGLFNRINFSYSNNPLDRINYHAGSVYKGYNSDYIAIKTTHLDKDSFDYWDKIGTKVNLGEKGEFISNCKINTEMSFDDMRLIMYTEGVIDYYQIGFATPKELIEVLKYAYNYYGLYQPNNQKSLVKK